MKLLEIHLLQSFVPSVLNRDDTGSPKDALFGGQRRARVSSQSWKKAMRDYMEEVNLLTKERLAMRSKRLHEMLTKKLTEDESDAETADYVAEAALSLIGAFHVETDKAEDDASEAYSERELKSEVLVFLGQDSVDAVVAVLRENWQDATEAAKAAKKYRDDLRGGNKYKGGLDNKDKFRKAAIKAFGKDVTARLEEAFDGRKAVDLALFGRMLADLPQKNVDGSMQVAHAISTHAVNREFDFYTAVDDLRPEDTSGADMLGTIEFNSACHYRYGVVDLEQLWLNLGGERDEEGNVRQEVDAELLEAGLHALLRAFVEAIPSGKQNSTAAQNPPSFGALRVQGNAQPRNLANAFEMPIRKSDKGFVAPSIHALADEWEWVDATYGDSGEVFSWVRHAELPYLDNAPENKHVVKGSREGIDRAVKAAMELLTT